MIGTGTPPSTYQPWQPPEPPSLVPVALGLIALVALIVAIYAALNGPRLREQVKQHVAQAMGIEDDIPPQTPPELMGQTEFTPRILERSRLIVDGRAPRFERESAGVWLVSHPRLTAQQLGRRLDILLGFLSPRYAASVEQTADRKRLRIQFKSS